MGIYDAYLHLECFSPFLRLPPPPLHRHLLDLSKARCFYLRKRKDQVQTIIMPLTSTRMMPRTQLLLAKRVRAILKSSNHTASERMRAHSKFHLAPALQKDSRVQTVSTTTRSRSLLAWESSFGLMQVVFVTFIIFLILFFYIIYILGGVVISCLFLVHELLTLSFVVCAFLHFIHYFHLKFYIPSSL